MPYVHTKQFCKELMPHSCGVLQISRHPEVPSTGKFADWGSGKIKQDLGNAFWGGSQLFHCIRTLSLSLSLSRKLWFRNSFLQSSRKMLTAKTHWPDLLEKPTSWPDFHENGYPFFSFNLTISFYCGCCFQHGH